MFSLFSSENRQFNLFSDGPQLNLEADFEDIFDDIDNEKVCCTTPTNKFSAFSTSQVGGFNEKTSKTKSTDIESLSCNGDNHAPVINCSEQSIQFIDRNKIEEELKQTSIDQLSEQLKDVDKDSKLSSNRTDLSNRQDVVNKAFLRHLKRYYLNIFKNSNVRIVRARFCNAKSSEVMQAIKRTFKCEFEDICVPQELYYYLMGILKLKDISRMFCSDETKRDVLALLDCCRHYSKVKFDLLFRSSHLQVLCKNFVSKNPSNGNCASVIQNMKDL